MTFKEFMTRGGNKGMDIPEELQIFKNNNYQYNCKIDNDNPKNSFLEYNNENRNLVRFQFDEYLSKVLANSDLMLKIHESIVSHFENYNKFWNDLPLFLIRRHGNYKGEVGGRKRRRGWMVKFNDAWIIYVDNFFPRHFFEAPYFIDSIELSDIRDLIYSFEMPFSSGGGKYEEKHRLFPSIPHITNSSNLYLSHLYDLNQGHYNIKGTIKTASHYLGKGIQSRFGCGSIDDWKNGKEISQKGRKYRIINEDLGKQTLQFLKANNIRSLSPLNYFPYPKTKTLKGGSHNGECNYIKELLINKYFKVFGKNVYEGFIKAVGAHDIPTKKQYPQIKVKIEDKKKRANLADENSFRNSNLRLNTMNKREAFDYLNNNNLRHAVIWNEFTFSNRNRANGNWWLEPDINRFQSNQYIGLFDNNSSVLHVFYIPAFNLIPAEVFYLRNDINRVSMRIEYGNQRFLDLNSNIGFELIDYHERDINCS